MKKIIAISSLLLVVIIVTVGLPMLSRIKKASLKMAAEQQRQVDAWEVPPADESGSLDDVNTLADDDGKTSSESLDEASDLEGTSDTALPTEQPLAMTFKEIPAGTFMMGSPETERYRSDDEHQHKVTISKAFDMQTTEVTQSQWKAVMGTEPWKKEKDSYFVKEGPNYPANYISWDDAVAYCKKLSGKEGKTYRLPTEAEWEYACRAGTKTAWSFGDDANAVGDFAWHDKNASRIRAHYPHHVGLKKPNAFGLFDMHGNVREFCNDYYAGNYYTQSPETDPAGPTAVSFRVIRGGCFGDPVPHLRSASRHPDDFVDNFGIIGFRVVREKD